MEKLVLISVFSIHFNLLGIIFYMHELLSNTPAGEATKTNGRYDFHQFETYDSQGSKRIIISYFDLEKHEALIPYESPEGIHDFRPLETLYYEKAQESMKFHRLHRGKIGLFIGFCTGTMAGVTLFDQFKKFRSPTKD